MIDQIKNHFGGSSVCFIENIKHYKFGVLDDDIQTPCTIQWNPNDICHFTVNNNKQGGITFLAIDKCIYTSSDSIKRCDFSLLNHKTFCFVEIKNSTNRKCNRVTEGIEQLETTIKSLLPILNNHTYTKEAYLAFITKKPIPTSTNFKNAVVRFFESYDVTLSDNNEVFFD